MLTANVLNFLSDASATGVLLQAHQCFWSSIFTAWEQAYQIAAQDAITLRSAEKYAILMKKKCEETKKKRATEEARRDAIRADLQIITSRP